MYKTINLPVLNCCICEGRQYDFTDHYPSSFLNIDILPNSNLIYAERGLGLKLITTETNPSEAQDGYAMAVFDAMINEDCSIDGSIFIDVLIRTKNNNGSKAQTNLKCLANGVGSAEAKIFDLIGNGIVEKVSFEIDLDPVTESPFSILFFLYSGSALITPDAGYTCMDEFTLMSARVRYPVKTINLRDADIDI